MHDPPLQELWRGYVLTREIDAEKPWIIDFWMGGWDPDAACGFMQGYISIPEK
jgi:hypothetical protein